MVSEIAEPYKNRLWLLRRWNMNIIHLQHFDNWIPHLLILYFGV